ncbi:hypothetical protein CANARDRAFT_211796 [[Candida] arabinofermentans NRRL YB-2248]|uniref:Uncharacterized protein n=1 Tax=[Candida] arabinofermentans NRRL YB-2248 TaxID=983967 RepID=A0A1E4T3S2_9ASCO|nr:hypothetical protein CANARDRAFT_211796 [[Candida] arabinofermentans NRRL YB-2248]
MNRSGKTLKLSKKLLQKEKSRLENEPHTADDYFILGTDEEESGDRWFASDISKALRFYQRAYGYYRTSLSLDSTSIDTWYNVSRLLFSVYTQYIKNEGVNLNDLENVSDALKGDESSVIQSLTNIIKIFQTSIEISNSKTRFPWDLYYNAVLCYFEYIEELNQVNDNQFNELVQCFIAARDLLLKVMDFQIVELRQLTTSLETSHESNVEASSVVDNDDHRYISGEETILPSTIVDTCLTGYRLVTAVYESISSDEQLSHLSKPVHPFINTIDTTAILLESEFSNSRTEMIPSLTTAEKDQLTLARLSYVASQAKSFEELKQVWSTSELSDSIEKYMLEASSYRTLIEKLSETSMKLVDQELWKVLSIMNLRLKSAYDQIKVKYDNLKSQRFNNNDETSSIISQLCLILIERADIELERSQLSTTDERTRGILQTNYKNLLKNSLTISQQSGGIRESQSDKLVRQKRQKESLIRLCLVDNKTTPEELDKIVGPGYWEQELSEISELAIYAKFNVGALLS